MRGFAALFGAAALALANLANLVGAGYSRYTSGHLDRPDAVDTRAAAEIAATWPPWSSSHAALYGWVLAETEKTGQAHFPAEAAYARALRLAPGDALLWDEYALALARLGAFDERLLQATRRAQALAPNSPAVRRSVADMGLSYWQRGNAEQRAAWLISMREELGASRAAFLSHAFTRGQGRTFCEGPAEKLGEARWCESVASALVGGCFTYTPVGPVPCPK